MTLLFGRMWNTSKVADCCKKGLSSLPSRRLKDSSVENKVDYEGIAQEVSENNIRNWTKDHSYILVKNVVGYLLSLS